jgi:hypothetical protein
VARRVAARGGFAYVACGQGGLRIIDAGQPEHPLFAAACAPPEAPTDVALAGHFAYVLGTEQHTVLDVRDPRRPREAGHFATVGEAAGLDADARRLVVTTRRGELALFDLAEPAAPARGGTVALDGTPTQVVLRGDRAYVSCGDAGLAVVDVSDIDAPRLLRTVDGVFHLEAADVRGTRAFLAQGVGGLSIVDLSATPARGGP